MFPPKLNSIKIMCGKPELLSPLDDQVHVLQLCFDNQCLAMLEIRVFSVFYKLVPLPRKSSLYSFKR